MLYIFCGKKAKRPGKSRSLPYSAFGFQGANTSPNVIDGVDGIHHSAISGQTSDCCSV